MWPKIATLLVIILVLQIADASEYGDYSDNSTETAIDYYYYQNLTSDNSLWTKLFRNCVKDPTIRCVQKNVFEFLQETFEENSNEIQFTDYLKFAPNHNKIKFDNTSLDNDNIENTIEDLSPFEEISRSLHDKSVKFLMTHDMVLNLPENFFDGALLKISPREMQEDGTLVKLEVVPRDLSEAPQGRLFKKLKKFISERLVWALMAILLIIKMVAAKFMFFLPAVVGAVTAKKLLIKVLLFLFPFLHHLFKLCAYTPHGTKFHHHHHKIQHLHHIGHGPPHSHHGHPHSVEVISPHAEGPPSIHHGHHDHHEHDEGYEVEGPHWHAPSIHHNIDIEPPHKPLYQPHEQELEYFSGGPALAHHFINHRQDPSYSPSDDNEVKWGQGHQTKQKNRPLAPAEIETMILKAEKEALIKERLKQERLKIQQENARLQEQLKQAMKLQDKLKQAVVIKNKIAPQPSQFLKTPPLDITNNNNIVAQQQQLLLKQQKEQLIRQELLKKQALERQATVPPPAIQQQVQQSEFEKALHQAATITYDPFYSPILEKIDKILDGLGFSDEPCRERLICSMYKNPVKFSPHSNLLSAELSRDSKELQKPKTTNAAVIRFYRYVQAARDGQDKRECLRLYPACSINTEQ